MRIRSFKVTQSCPCGYKHEETIISGFPKLNGCFQRLNLFDQINEMTHFIICPKCGSVLSPTIAEKMEEIYLEG